MPSNSRRHTIAADRLTRFTDRAQAYARYRPTYPPTAIDAMLDGFQAANVTAADIGAGTGISSRLLADRGCQVIAIEPNAAMRHAAESHPRVRWVEGTGEHTGLTDHSVDLVLCAQAFHWLEPSTALNEFRRILKHPTNTTPGGRVALMWNIYDASSPVTREYKKVILSHAHEPPTSPWFIDPQHPLVDAPGFVNQRTPRFPNAQLLDLDGLLGRAFSASYAPKEGTALESFQQALQALFDRYAESGRIRLSYVTEVHLAEVSA